MDAQSVGKEMGIEHFADSHVERMKSNKNFEKKSGFKHAREKTGQCECSLFGSSFLVIHSERITFSNTLINLA